jgi:hypothetical protein
VEAGSNTSTVALRVIGSDEMGSLESETVKYGHESHDSDPKMTALTIDRNIRLRLRFRLGTVQRVGD